MSLRDRQNAEVYEEMVSSGKSLLQLYLELKDRYEWLKGAKEKPVIHGYDQHFPTRADQTE
jgi:hypothetical protein